MNDKQASQAELDAAPTGPSIEPDGRDPWIHRSKGMLCSTCMWYVTKDADDSAEPAKAKGRCRRHAPTMNGYPVVFIDDWCGDHKLS